jgi:hypothetical protein
MSQPTRTVKDFTPNKKPPIAPRLSRSSVTASPPNRSPSPRPKKASAFRHNLRVPAASIKKAKAVFTNFNLSNFAGKEPPANYVVAGKDRASVQKQMVIQKLKDLKGQQNPNVGMTVALPKVTVQQVFPKLNQTAKTIDLSDLMDFVQQNMRGKQFFASGNPTLNRLSIRSQVQQILRTQKGGTK